MDWTPKLIRLRDLLARRYYDKGETFRLVQSAGLPPDKISFDDRAITNWHYIVEAAVSRQRLGALVEVCVEDCGDVTLREAYNDYLNEPRAVDAAAPPEESLVLTPDPAAGGITDERPAASVDGEPGGALSQSFACVLFIAPPPVPAVKRSFLARLSWVRLLPPPKKEKTPHALLRVIREEVAAWGAANPGAVEWGDRWEGVVVVARADHAALLRLALHIALTVVTPEGERPRMGLHFVPTTGAEKPPYEGEFIAQRLALLGRGGHFLVTEAAHAFVESNPALASVLSVGPERESPITFRVAGVAPLRLDEPMQIYNVVGDGFGNAKRPSLKLPEPVIVKFPRTLLETRKDKIKAAFREGLPYVRAEFKFKDKGKASIVIDCEKPAVGDCAFELDFERLDDKREQSFGIELLDRAGRKSATLLLRCYDRFGEQLAPEIVRPPIRLRSHYLLWLWDRIKFSRWYVKTALALALALAVAAPVYLLGPWPKFWEVSKTGVEEVAGPDVGSDLPALHFKSVEDTDDYWDMSPPTIALGQGHGGSTNKALDLSGPRVIFLNPDLVKGKAYYDFELALMIKLKPGTKMGGWVLRAQPGSRRGYWFALERKPDNKLVLHGTYVGDDDTDLTAVDDPESQVMNRLGLPLRDIPVGDFLQDDWAEVMITVSGNKFSHTIRRKSGTEGITDSGFQRLAPDFVDTDSHRFPHGGLGLWVSNGGGMLVDYWVVSNSHK